MEPIMRKVITIPDEDTSSGDWSQIGLSKWGEDAFTLVLCETAFSVSAVSFDAATLRSLRANIDTLLGDA